MEEIFKLVGFCIVAVCLILVIKEQRKEIALILTIFTCISLLLFVISKIQSVYDLLIWKKYMSGCFAKCNSNKVRNGR